MTRTAVVGPALGAGVTVLPLLLGGTRARDAVPVLTAARRATPIAAGVWMGSALLTGWLAAAQTAALAPLQLPVGRLADYLTAVGAGRALLVVLVVAAALAASALTGSLPAGVAPAVVAVGLLALPVTGHAATAPPRVLAVLSVAAHVVAAGFWIGGLAGVVLLVAARRGLLAVVLPRFSRLAGGCLLVVAITGLLNALVLLPSPSTLLTTGYGALIIGKTGCLIDSPRSVPTPAPGWSPPPAATGHYRPPPGPPPNSASWHWPSRWPPPSRSARPTPDRPHQARTPSGRGVTRSKPRVEVLGNGVAVITGGTDAGGVVAAGPGSFSGGVGEDQHRGAVDEHRAGEPSRCLPHRRVARRARRPGCRGRRLPQRPR